MATYCPYCMSPALPGQLCSNCGEDPAGYHSSSHHFPPEHLLLNRYLVGKVLGEGGFGITYLGLDTTQKRRVAIKEYFPNMFVHRESSVSLDVICYTGEKQTLYEKGRDQFLQEARVMAQFDGFAGIVQLLGFFPANNTAYIVMELLTGSTLQTVLDQQGRIPAKHLFELMEPVLRTMNAVHGAGIIHRDISPDNIMLLDSGQVKLLDFGCARDIDKNHTLTVMLKHGYAPMEQYTGHNQGPWTDVYALCATFYHCLTGQKPPRALDRVTDQDPLIPPNRLGAALTPEQEQALLRGLAVKSKNRWQNMAGLYAALYGTAIKVFPWRPEYAKTELPPERKTESLPESEPEPEAKKKSVLHLLAQKKKLLMGIAACLLVFLMAFGIWWRIDAGSSELPSSPAASEQGTERPPRTEEPKVSELPRFSEAPQHTEEPQPSEATVFIRESSTISAGASHTVCLKSDGTVVAAGSSYYGLKDWTDIIAVSAGQYLTIGLKSDGTVVAVGYNDDGQCDVGDWTDIVAVSAGYHAVGLKSDGTVVAVGKNIQGRCDVGQWMDIVAISAGYRHTVGLKSDGTVVAVGYNDDGQCDVGDWTDIVAIAAGDCHTVGLKSDGTVVVVGSNKHGQCDVGDWTDIVAVSVGGLHTVGLKSDGTVVAVGRNYSGQCKVGAWTDIVMISAGGSHTVGLKSDGTVIAVGYNMYGQCDVDDWTDIRLPD